MNGDITFSEQGACDESGPLPPTAAAAVLVSWLEQQGAILELDAQDFVRTNLNPIADLNYERADTIARAVHSLRDQIRAILVGRRRVH